MNKLSKLILKFPFLVALIGILFGLWGAYYTVLLYQNLRTDIEELLPTNARSIIDLNEVTSRLEAIDNIVVLVFSQDKKASRRFVDDLAGILEKTKKDVISGVEYKIDREVKFFSDRRALMMELQDLVRIRNFIRDKIEYEKELFNPLNIFSQIELNEPHFDFNALQKKYAGQTSVYAKFPDGYYATPDEKVRIVIAYMPGKGIEAAHRLRGAIDDAVKLLDPKKYAPDLEVKFTGNIQNLIEENAALIADLVASTVIVIILVTLIMFVYFRTIMATLALIWSLFFGTFWSFGVSYFAVGYLNANSAFLASIVLGNGINCGIIFLSRYIEERRNGRSNDESVTTAMTSTAVSTWTASFGAGLAYGSLILTGFRGFKQFGVIGLIGMTLCWISAYTLLPAFLTLIDRTDFGKKIVYRPYHAPIMVWISRFVEYFAKPIWIVAVALIIASFFTLKNVKDGVIEVDLNAMRDKESMEHGSGFLSKYIDEVFQHGLSPMVILPKERDQARKIAAAFLKKKKEEGDKTLFTTIQQLDDFVPADQIQKIHILKDIQRLLTPQILRVLPDVEKKLVKDFLNPRQFVPFTEADLPPLLLGKFKERDQTVGKMVLVDKIMGHGTDRLDVQIPFVQEVREIVDSVAPGSAIAGQLPVSTDMLAAVVRDGPRATLFAFLAVVVLVIVLFRDVKVILQILFALCVGVVWMGGVMLATHLKINFLNFIALPITFGIGVDYGVNVFHRYQLEGKGSILRVVENTGGAVMLCSLTTIIGYSSLLIAGNQAFVSFGRLAVLGEITCVLAAVIAMPAFLRFLEKRSEATEEMPALERYDA